jgi:hypothetical protein
VPRNAAVTEFSLPENTPERENEDGFISPNHVYNGIRAAGLRALRFRDGPERQMCTSISYPSTSAYS